MTKWTFGDAVKAKVRDHTSKADFTEKQWCWRRAGKLMKKTDPENRERSSGSLTRELTASMAVGSAAAPAVHRQPESKEAACAF